MRSHLYVLVSLVLIMGLTVNDAKQVGKTPQGPARIEHSTGFRTALDASKVSQPEIEPLLNEGERIIEPLSLPNPEDTINYDGPNFNAVGLTGAGTFEAAIRLTPTELASYSGWEIVAILWYHYELPDHIVDSVMVYDNGTSTTPGPLLHSQPASLTGLGWLREDLSNPVPIAGASDLWAGVWFTLSDTAFPAGIDAGPAIPFKGDMIFYGGSWAELRDFGLDYNWNIRAIVDSGIAPPANDVRTLSINSPGSLEDPNTPIYPMATVRNVGTNPATFDVICNIDSILTSVYRDTFTIVGMASATDSSVTFGNLWTPVQHCAGYQVRVNTVLAGDQNPSNDTLTGASNAFDTTVTPIVSPFTISPPTINGIFAPGEWSDATVLDVSDVLGKVDAADPSCQAFLYVKNDSSNLYIGVDGFGDMTSSDYDELGLYFDDNNNNVFGTFPDISEGNIWMDNLAAGDGASFRWIADPDSFGPTVPVSFPVQVTMSSGHEQFEGIIPLGSLDEELNASPGDTVGFFFFVLDGTPFTFYGWWPYNTNASTGWYTPSDYGDLILSATVGVEEETPDMNPKGFALYETRPNPISSRTEIHYLLSEKGEAALNLYDISGRLIRTLVNGVEEAGEHRVAWDGRDDAGMEVSSGLYFYRLTTGRESATRKLVFLK